MSRLLATIQWDVRLQFRNGFYYAAAFVAAMFIAALFRNEQAGLAVGLPVLIMNNLMINAFYFIAGIVLLEKGEGTMEAQVVTPLRGNEYLSSKIITLGILSLVESTLIVGLTYGLKINFGYYFLGVFLMSLILALMGFMAVAKYDSLNEFLFPSFLFILPLSIPMLYNFGILKHWIFLLHPLQAPLFLLKATFQTMEPWQIIYGIVYSLISLLVLFIISNKIFDRFVIRKEGVSR
jgi:fluoroquinolone transport system permease protein